MNSFFKSANKALFLAACCALVIATKTSTTFAQAQEVSPSVSGDEYSGTTPGGAEPTPEEKEKFVKDSVKITKCEDGLCDVFSVTVNKRTFNFTTSAGTGMNNSGLSGSTNNYYGSSVGGVNTGMYGKLTYNVQFVADDTKCVKSINVLSNVADVINTYMASMINTTPGENPVVPEFVPSQQTISLFYVNIMELAKASTCN